MGLNLVIDTQKNKTLRNFPKHAPYISRYPMLIYRENGVDTNRYINNITKNQTKIEKLANPKHLNTLNPQNSLTLYIDGIDTYNGNTQNKILQIIKEPQNQIYIIATAQPDLIKKTQNGLFNTELFYLLNLKIHAIPPLRERKSDIPNIIAQYIEEEIQKQQKYIQAIEKNTLNALTQYQWPENDKQLKQTIKRAIAISRGDILSHHDFPQIPIKQSKNNYQTIQVDQIKTEKNKLSINLKKQNGHIKTFAEVEADMLKIALQKYNGKLTEIARRLGIGRATLYRKINLYKINPQLSKQNE